MNNKYNLNEELVKVIDVFNRGEYKIGVDDDKEAKVISISMIDKDDKIFNTLINYKDIETVRSVSIEQYPLLPELSLNSVYGVILKYLSLNHKYEYSIDLSNNKLGIKSNEWYKIINSLLFGIYYGRIKRIPEKNMLRKVSRHYDQDYNIDILVSDNKMKINYLIPFDDKASKEIAQEVLYIINYMEDVLKMKKVYNDIIVEADITKDKVYEEEIDDYHSSSLVEIKRFGDRDYFKPYQQNNYYRVEDGVICVRPVILNLGNILREILEYKNIWEYNERNDTNENS